MKNYIIGSPVSRETLKPISDAAQNMKLCHIYEEFKDYGFIYEMLDLEPHTQLIKSVVYTWLEVRQCTID